MNTMIFLKRIFWIILFCAVIYGGYTLYTGWWNDGSGFSRTKEYIQNVLGQKGEEIKGQVQDKANEVVSSTKQTALNYIEEKTSEALSSIKQSIINKASDVLGVSQETQSPQTGVFQGGIIAAPSGERFSAPPPPATITANVGFPLVFSINKNASYSVDWGDGEKTSGTSSQNEVALLKHTWSSDGDYNVKINIGSESSTDYIFPVRIYK